MKKIRLVEYFEFLPANLIRFSEHGESKSVLYPPSLKENSLWYTEKRLVETSARTLSIIQEDDILMSTKPGVLSVKVAPKGYSGFIASRYCLILRPLQNSPALLEWAKNWFSSAQFRSEFEAIASSSSIGVVRTSSLMTLEIPVIDFERLRVFQESSKRLADAVNGIEKTLVIAKKLKQLETDLLFSD